ncbi:hypothetical protein OCH239_12365 [Roseivivax halodurans JCM 10272]|uniref:Uncharacterized protein n=1 Tax=Roseivivax halodurans JCM 10272 TaxID=1449350 RepID=X7EBR0_9RHOB|nr:hypothetical protein OCH239_12365 [Roseivivax halodurans JCM 10272]
MVLKNSLSRQSLALDQNFVLVKDEIHPLRRHFRGVDAVTASQNGLLRSHLGKSMPSGGGYSIKARRLPRKHDISRMTDDD